jgi:acyl carrier protein
MEFEQKIISIIKDNVEEKLDTDITPDSELMKDLGVDSLNSLLIVFQLEQEFSISLDESDFSRLKTVSDVITNLRERYPQLEGT